MKLGTKIALGIDVSQSHINLALLGKDHKGVKLLKAASGPVPAGAIKDGRIENAAALAKAVHRLKNRIEMRTIPTAVSLFTGPTILQVMNIPGQVPDNIGNFIQQQVKNFAALLRKKIAMDFCSVSGADSGASLAGRVLTVATDGQKVDELVAMFRRAGVVVDSIEPAFLACTRALYADRIEGKFDSNVIIAVLRDDSLTVGVFRKQMMDFVRTRQLSEEKTQPQQLCQWLAAQINMITQSYDVETPYNSQAWEVTIVADWPQLSPDARQTLAVGVTTSNLQLLSPEDISQITAVSRSRRRLSLRRTDKPSLIAVGLAMKLLDTSGCNLRANLLPAEVVRVRSTRRRALIAANVVATVLLFMMLAAGGLIWRLEKTNENINRKRSLMLKDTHGLVEKRKLVGEQVNAISAKLDLINKILDSRCDANWPGLLSDIAKTRPKTVCVTSLLSQTDSQMSLKGLAVSNEDVYLFVDRLSKSEHIRSASIVETKKDKDNNGLVSYEIRCNLTARKGV